jgi:hypothetical protein
MGLIIEVSIGLLFVPSWISSYILSSVSVLRNFNAINLINLFDSVPLFGYINIGILLIIVLMMLMLYEWVSGIKQSFYGYIWTVSITLSLSSLISLNLLPTNQVILFLPLSVIFSAIASKWKNNGIKTSSILILLIGLAGWGIWSADLLSNNLLVLYFPLFTIIGLYWVRHWNRNTYEKYTVPTRYLDALKNL